MSQTHHILDIVVFANLHNSKEERRRVRVKVKKIRVRQG